MIIYSLLNSSSATYRRLHDRNNKKQNAKKGAHCIIPEKSCNSFLFWYQKPGPPRPDLSLVSTLEHLPANAVPPVFP